MDTSLRRFIDLVNPTLSLVEGAIPSILAEGVAIHDPDHMAAYMIVVAEAYDAAPRMIVADRKPWDILDRHNREVLLRQIAGSGVHVEYSEDDPYSGPGGIAMIVRRMLWDMVMNKHLVIYSGQDEPHPVFSKEGNAIFRTVHDFYAHGKLRTVLSQEAKRLGLKKDSIPDSVTLEKLLPKIDLTMHGNQGGNFAARGEMNAYTTHCRLAPPAAIPALFTEVVGQICYFSVTGSYAPQKIAILRDFNFSSVGETVPNSHAALRMTEIIKAINDGAETIETSIAAKPTILVSKLITRVTRKPRVREEKEEPVISKNGSLLAELNAMVSKKSR